jgi:hypothetical protein
MPARYEQIKNDAGVAIGNPAGPLLGHKRENA